MLCSFALCAFQRSSSHSILYCNVAFRKPCSSAFLRADQTFCRMYFHWEFIGYCTGYWTGVSVWGEEPPPQHKMLFFPQCVYIPPSIQLTIPVTQVARFSTATFLWKEDSCPKHTYIWRSFTRKRCLFLIAYVFTYSWNNLQVLVLWILFLLFSCSHLNHWQFLTLPLCPLDIFHVCDLAFWH